MTLNDFYDRVARRADTAGTGINVAETKRVIACYFSELSRLPAADAAVIQARGLVVAERKRRLRKGKG